MIRYVEIEDTADCLALMELVKEDFAGYKEQEFTEALHRAAQNREALLDEEEGTAAGLLLFSHEDKELTLLAVHPQYRKRNIAKNLIRTMKSRFEKGEDIHVITFREGDPKGIAARKCYASCGFTEGEELVVFDYPCQKLLCRL